MTARPQTRRAPQQERSRQMVARLLGAAARLFAQRGYEGTTTNHIAEEAGVSVGSLYQFFPDKGALLTSLQAIWTERLRVALDGVLRDAASQPLEVVIDHVLGVHARLNADPPGLLGLLLVTPSATSEQENETVRAEVQGRLEGLLEVRAPGLTAQRRSAVARMSIHIANGLYAPGGPTGVADPSVRAEVRAALLAYLRPIVRGVGEGGSAAG